MHSSQQTKSHNRTAATQLCSTWPPKLGSRTHPTRAETQGTPPTHSQPQHNTPELCTQRTHPLPLTHPHTNVQQLCPAQTARSRPAPNHSPTPAPLHTTHNTPAQARLPAATAPLLCCCWLTLQPGRCSAAAAAVAASSRRSRAASAASLLLLVHAAATALLCCCCCSCSSASLLTATHMSSTLPALPLRWASCATATPSLGSAATWDAARA